MNFIEKKEKIEQIIKTISSDDLRQDLNVCLIKNGDEILPSSQKMKVKLNALAEEGRDLRIGIVGQVKAGKSSLLNALLFNGEDVLPKAATPMTAALTIMTYSENSQAEIEFFSQEDIAIIKSEHNEYAQELEKVTKQIKVELEKKAKYTLEEINEKSLKKANNQVKKSDRFSGKLASYEQYEKIKTSGIDYTKLPPKKILSEVNLDRLIKQDLQEYIGADGKYMPFTKSVSLAINHKGLKDLAVVDTPGINDPVQSRGKRTYEELGNCDVILIVSNAGRFLDKTDMEFIENVRETKGITNERLYIVASQADNQLHGDIAQKSEKDLQKALKLLTDTFNQQAQLKATECKQDGFKNAIICSSGAAYSLLKRFDSHQTDSNLKTVWSNLTFNYSKDFSDENKMKSLEKLANIETIDKVLEHSRENKTKFVLNKIKAAEAQYQNNLNIYIDNLVKKLNELIDEIKKGDINQYQKEKLQLEKLKQPIKDDLHYEYNKIIESQLNNLTNTLKLNLIQFQNNVASQQRENEGMVPEEISVRKTRQVKRNIVMRGLSFLTGGLIDDYDLETYYVTDYRNVKTFSTEKFKTSYIESIENVENKLKQGLIDKNIICKDLELKINELLKKYNNQIEFNKERVESTIEIVKNHIPNFVFSLNKEIPSSLERYGILKGDDAEKYCKNIEFELGKLSVNIEKQKNSFIDNFSKSLSQIDISEIFIRELDRQINSKISAINDREHSIQVRQDLIKEISKI